MRPQLVAQSEVQVPGTGYFVGVEVFETVVGFDIVLHARTYDGMKVASSYRTEPQRLEADDREAARVEARDRLREFATLYLPPKEG